MLPHMRPQGHITLLTWVVHSVSVLINGGFTGIEVKTLPLHKKNPDIGEKKTVYSSTILLEQEDAASLEDQEEVSPFGIVV